ncbi:MULTISPECIES: HlyD family efflux transporter periplasmic adaptor subunit [Acinetobacter]|jgi:membrane fusion protein (multidrug efflux system)|uniref:HlyD family secretion protein n=1 Tax=Acinetobacter TaxID=469 RepID=UPI000C3D5224|nr:MULTISPECIES: HlyD family efflux transporter periplasmic adaptor subunit [Acinetobacter]MBC69380.1 EmrA/EmrK family multidrug efflux transporter periplasmic adaptor subunit [Acinetobacter sp.]MBT50496.1 EmrA/EmrK family multidrug efflux transporter periplasmic adaptor subunit [Acinetobacter sp.]HIQ36322.1 HlyD family efflux transporter periplasmic adaptor subunit [Acinetobacter venetianus]HJP48868.1 HlyD family efflux transporter periplasmic adaptor subunit [Acinetobacter venetianus]|tara:strand:- start:420 stop:1568 length:1149 start_codon:yes stop_codon:yes gene_type:complete
MSDAQANQQDAALNSASDDAMKAKRKKFLGFFALILILAAILYGIWAIFFNHSVTTDNAYVGAETAQITSMVSGQVADVLVKDTQQVKQGDVLVRIDERDAKIQLAQAQAELAKAQRQYKQSQANSSSLNSQVVVRNDEIISAQAQVTKAQADFDRATLELKRRNELAASGAISKEELSKAQSAVSTAKASLDLAQAGLAQATSSRKAAESTLAANEALIQGVNESSTPDVLVAQAHVEQAKLDLDRTVIRAPVDGVVTRKNIQIGQRVAPGTVIMSVVPVAALYVDANYKESQLAKVKAGQKVTLKSDLYGDDVVYHGVVQGFSGGTGAAFALIPAQNATGNWIKVVQRLPVRISLDPKELAEHPLRVGLSMEADIDLASK